MSMRDQLLGKRKTAPCEISRSQSRRSDVGLCTEGIVQVGEEMIMSDVFCRAVWLRVRARILNGETQSKRCVTEKIQFKDRPVLLTLSRRGTIQIHSFRSSGQSSRASGSPGQQIHICMCFVCFVCFMCFAFLRVFRMFGTPTRS